MNPSRAAASAGLSILLGLLSWITAATAAGPPLTWQRTEALAAARSVDTDAAVRQIFRGTPLSRGPEILHELRLLESRDDWPLPAREAALYHFARQLANLRRADVAPSVLQYLQSYKARTLVPQEDHAEAVVPLYNIPAAAAGVDNAWRRREAAEKAGALLQEDPSALVDLYIANSGNAQRSGYIEALKQAGPAALEAVQRAARARLADAPELTPLLGATLAAKADTGVLGRLLADGGGAGLASALQRAAATLTAGQLSSMLREAVENAPAGNAALAIAQWWPALRHDDAARQLLLDHLADPVLGEAAALALAQSPDVATIRALQTLAEGDSASARRAQLALAVNRGTIATETPR